MSKPAAYVISQAVAALIEALGMFAHDLAAVHHGNGQVYTEAAYEEVINKYQIHHNAVIHTLGSLDD
jgi:hypothetical protein